MSGRENRFTRKQSLKTNFETYSNTLKELCYQKTRFITDIEFATKGCGDREIFLRHDVDYTLERLLTLARLEKKCGVISTYYFLVSDIPGYDINDTQFSECINGLRKEGHGVGVHVSLTNGVKIADISSEINLFTIASGVRPSSFTLHNPTLLDMNSLPEIVDGVINVSHPKRFENCPYSSDSNGIPKGFMLNVKDSKSRESGVRGCLLTHPIWWVHARYISPREKIIWALLMKLRRELECYDMLLAANGRINSKHGLASRILRFLFVFADKYYA